MDRKWMTADPMEYELLKENARGNRKNIRKSKVIVEIDGGYHFTEKQQTDDAVRTDWLEQHGYKVIRFTNEQVLCDTDNVINELRKVL